MTRIGTLYTAIAIGTLLGVAPAAAAFKYVEEGQKAPDFTLKDLSGEPIQLEKRLGPKGLVIAFWATWSARSKPALDDLEALYRERKDKGLEVLAVNVDHEHLSDEDLKAVKALAAQWSFPVLLDDGLALYAKYGVVATPSFAILDAQGTIRFARAGYSSSAKGDIKDAVDGLLGLAEEKAERLHIKMREYVPPKKATLHYQKALVLIQRGMGKKAVKDLEEAAGLDPSWAEPRVELARLYRAEARRQPELLAKAEAVLREAKAARPKHVQTLTSLAEVLLAEGKAEESLGEADQALAAESGYTPALLAKARGLSALKRGEEAGKAVDEALSLDPRSASAHALKGELAAARGDWREAAGALRTAVEAGFSVRDGSE